MEKVTLMDVLPMVASFAAEHTEALLQLPLPEQGLRVPRRNPHLGIEGTGEPGPIQNTCSGQMN